MTAIFERHLGFLEKLMNVYWGLLVWCSAHIPGVMRKDSACCKLVRCYN